MKKKSPKARPFAFLPRCVELKALLLALASLAACLPLAAQDTASAFHDRVLENIRLNNVTAAPPLFLEEIRDDPQFRRYLPAMWSGLQKALLRRDFSEQGRAVYSKGPVKAGQEIAVGEKGRFLARFDAPGDEGAAWLMASEKDFQRHLFILIAIRRDARWYLQFAHAGLWQVGGFDAEGWFKRASDMLRRGHPVPAALAAQVAGSILRPAPSLRFAKEKEMEALAKKIEDQAAVALTLPLNLLKAPGYPQVIRLEPEFDARRLVPVVYYITRIAISD